MTRYRTEYYRRANVFSPLLVHTIGITVLMGYLICFYTHILRAVHGYLDVSTIKKCNAIPPTQEDIDAGIPPGYSKEVCKSMITADIRLLAREVIAYKFGLDNNTNPVSEDSYTGIGSIDPAFVYLQARKSEVYFEYILNHVQEVISNFFEGSYIYSEGQYLDLLEQYGDACHAQQMDRDDVCFNLLNDSYFQNIISLPHGKHLSNLFTMEPRTGHCCKCPKKFFWKDQRYGSPRGTLDCFLLSGKRQNYMSRSCTYGVLPYWSVYSVSYPVLWNYEVDVNITFPDPSLNTPVEKINEYDLPQEILEECNKLLLIQREICIQNKLYPNYYHTVRYKLYRDDYEFLDETTGIRMRVAASVPNLLHAPPDYSDNYFAIPHNYTAHRDRVTVNNQNSAAAYAKRMFGNCLSTSLFLNKHFFDLGGRTCDVIGVSPSMLYNKAEFCDTVPGTCYQNQIGTFDFRRESYTDTKYPQYWLPVISGQYPRVAKGDDRGNLLIDKYDPKNGICNTQTEDKPAVTDSLVYRFAHQHMSRLDLEIEATSFTWIVAAGVGKIESIDTTDITQNNGICSIVPPIGCYATIKVKNIGNLAAEFLLEIASIYYFYEGFTLPVPREHFVPIEKMSQLLEPFETKDFNLYIEPTEAQHAVYTFYVELSNSNYEQLDSSSFDVNYYQTLEWLEPDEAVLADNSMNWFALEEIMNNLPPEYSLEIFPYYKDNESKNGNHATVSDLKEEVCHCKLYQIFCLLLNFWMCSKYYWSVFWPVILLLTAIYIVLFIFTFIKKQRIKKLEKEQD